MFSPLVLAPQKVVGGSKDQLKVRAAHGSSQVPGPFWKAQHTYWSLLPSSSHSEPRHQIKCQRASPHVQGAASSLGTGCLRVSCLPTGRMFWVISSVPLGKTLGMLSPNPKSPKTKVLLFIF